MLLHRAVESFFVRWIRPRLHRLGIDVIRNHPSDVAPEIREIMRRCHRFTMTGTDALLGLLEAVDHVVKRRIPGDIVECGVWRGGGMMAVASLLLARNDRTRSLWLYDTFSGMPEPGAHDISMHGEVASSIYQQCSDAADRGSEWCRANLEEVRRNVGSVGYPEASIHYVQGRVEDTIPGQIPDVISILRCDTDFYDSTLHQLNHLYDRVVPGGVVILDDYGYWKGARKAADEFIAARNPNWFMTRLGYQGQRICVKLQ